MAGMNPYESPQAEIVRAELVPDRKAWPWRKWTLLETVVVWGIVIVGAPGIVGLILSVSTWAIVTLRDYLAQ
jgi:hypothetical protein